MKEYWLGSKRSGQAVPFWPVCVERGAGLPPAVLGVRIGACDGVEARSPGILAWKLMGQRGCRAYSGVPGMVEHKPGGEVASGLSRNE